MTQMYYTIAMSLFTGFSVAFNQHGLAALRLDVLPVIA
mgnify:CR=1 FL=1